MSIPASRPDNPADRVERQSTVSISGKYSLTETGMFFCMKAGIPIRDIRLRDGGNQTGFLWSKVDIAFLERLVSAGLLSGIEIERTEFLSLRNDFIVLLKSAVAGMLGQKSYGRSSCREPDEIRTRRLELAENVSFVIMEFIQYAEQAHFLNLAERDQFARRDPSAVPTLLADHAFRQRLMDRARLLNEFILLSIKFSVPTDVSVGRSVLSVAVRNKGIVGNQKRASYLNKRERSAKTGSFTDFLEEMTNDNGNDSIGLMVLNSLIDSCRDHGIEIETALVRDERSGETVASLRLSC
jgi:hypothetical protein